MSVSYNYGRNHVSDHQYKNGFDSSSSYDQGYSTQTRDQQQPRFYSHSVTSDGFSDISLDPYNTRQGNSRHNHNNYTDNVYSPDDPRRQVLDVTRLPLRDSNNGQYSRRPPNSIISSVGREADVESIASHQTQSTVTSYDRNSSASSYDAYRYNGELFRPVAAPRRVNAQTKKLFGEIHPRMLRPDEKPLAESGEETEDSYSIDSQSIIMPTPAPRASMRLSKSRTISFLEDEAIRQENLRLKGILKSQSMPSKLNAMGKKFVVRFEYVDKRADDRPRRDLTDYSDIDSDHGGKSKKKKADIWSHVAPMGPKPARNSMRGSSKGRQQRSSSADRSRSSQRSSGSRKRSNSTSSTSKRAQRSSSVNSRGSERESRQTDRHSSNRNRGQSDADNHQVNIQMPGEDKKKADNKNSMVGAIRKSNASGDGMCSDTQKVLKWALIIGIPVVLLIIVIIVVAVMFSQS